MAGRSAHSDRTDDYLEAIYDLGSAGCVTVTRLARRLGVSAPSVSEMLARLRRSGLVEERRHEGIGLTPTGHEEATRLIRRQRLGARFLTDYLGLPCDEVREDARNLGRALDDETAARLAERLGNPTTCPHGQPIPDEGGRVSPASTVRLSGLRAGQSAVVTRILDDDPAMLRRLARCGVLPGVRITVEAVQSDTGTVVLRVGDAGCALDREAAQEVLVDA